MPTTKKRTKQSKRQVIIQKYAEAMWWGSPKRNHKAYSSPHVRLASNRFPDFVEKVGRTSGKILATRLLKPKKTTGVLRNVLIICTGSYFQGSADQESFMTEWKPLVASSEKKSDNRGKRSFCEITQSLPLANFRRLDLRRWYVLPCGYLTFPVYGNTMQRYEQQTFTTLFRTLKSDFMDVKRFEF